MNAKLFLLIVLITNVVFVNAQMDDKFYYPKKDLREINWKNYETLEFTVENDTINGLLLKPETESKATIFYFQGAGGNNTYYIPLIKVLVENSFQVVMINFRGYGKSTGKPTHKNICEDGQKIFKELLEKDNIKNTKKLIYGISIGTQIATLLAKNNQEEISGLILEGAMASFTDIAIFYTPEYAEYLEKYYISPYSAKEDIKSLDNIPKYIIHSKEDKDVPFSQGKEVFENSPEPKEFLEFQGEHLYALKYKKDEIIEKINNMINAK